MTDTMKRSPFQLVLRFLIVFSISGLTAIYAQGQAIDSLLQEDIAITGRPFKHSITLRWAPLTHKAWHAANEAGYRVERYVILRNGQMLPEPLKQTIQYSAKPLPEGQWEGIVQRNRYAAIAAQALFGERFEIDLKQSDMFTIVNKIRENEQRFAFALFSADMSPEVAVASGLWLQDTTVVTGEKYLYRVIVNSVDSLRGSIFIGPDDPYDLPPPQNLKADFKEHFVSLKWDAATRSSYTAYIVERSENGDAFKSIFEAPLATVSPLENTDNRYEYAADSLWDTSKTYRYRVKGVSPFGETGPASAVVTGTAVPVIEQVPFIVAAETVNNTSIVIHWTFPETTNAAINGFAVERAPSPDQRFSSLTVQLLTPKTRTFEDRAPNQTNYYRIKAQGIDGEWYSSYDYFAQLIDSIPPAAPSGLKGTVDDTGKVDLSWNPNGDQDIFGYRVYKAYHSNEEPTQVTGTPIPKSFFADSVDLNTLNENLFYRVMAIDQNQNHSSLSDPLKISLPDKVKPQPPILLPSSAHPNGVGISWIPGGSEDIVAYQVFRKARGSEGWAQIRTVEAHGDSIYLYVDQNAPSGRTSIYTVLSIDDAGLESDPSIPITGVRIDRTLRPSLKWKKPRINREENQIRVSWEYTQPHVESLQLFRSVDNDPPLLFRSLTGNESSYTDIIIPGRTYSYWIMAIFEDGNKSSLSEKLEFAY